MKRIIILTFGIFILLFLSSCAIPAQEDESTSHTTLADGSTENCDAALHVHIPGAKTDQHIYHMAYGQLTPNSHGDLVAILSDCGPDTDMPVDTYLLTEMDGNYLTCELGQWDPQTMKIGDLVLEDLDMDGSHEIILQMMVALNGGSICHIYEIKDNALRFVADLNTLSPEINAYFKDDKEMVMENFALGYQQTIDISGYFQAAYFDETGTLTVLETPFLDIQPVNSFDVKQSILQYKRSLVLEGCYLGEFVFTAQYNEERKEYILTDVSFEGQEPTEDLLAMLAQAAAAQLSDVPEEYLTINHTVTFQNEQLICAVFEGTVSDPTAAHPTDFAFSLCADVAQMQIIDPLTLFSLDSNFIQAFREQLNTVSCPERFTPEDWESVRAYISAYSDDELLQIICATPQETLAFFPDSVTVLFPVPQSAGNHVKIPVPTVWNTAQS